MSSKQEQWTPTLVCPPQDVPHDRSYFNWQDPKIKKWTYEAMQMQEAHVKDNGKTEWFRYTIDQSDAIELRILMTIYGLRIPQTDSKGAPSCAFETYTDSEKDHACKIKEAIVEASNNSKEINFNVIYISTAAELSGKNEFAISEEPVFVVLAIKDKKYVDKDGKIYNNFQDYINNNNLPKGIMLFPKNGTYTLNSNETKVQLQLAETPAAASPLQRVQCVTTNVAVIAGIAFGLSGVVTYFVPSLYSATVAIVTKIGSFVLSGLSLTGAVYSIYDKTSRNERICSEVFLIAASIFTFGTGCFSQYWTSRISQYAREGKTFQEMCDKISRMTRFCFSAVRFLALASSLSSLFSLLYDMFTKKERTWMDYYQLSMAIFMTANVVLQPRTIKDVFESEQMQCLKEVLNSLESEEAREEMSKMMKEHSTSDKRAYMIRNLNQIDNPTEFFQLINKTHSVVTCTADGLTVNNKIDIHPRAYNEIGKAVFEDRIKQIQEYEKSAFQEQTMEEFKDKIPNDKIEEFNKKVQDIKNLPPEERKEKLENLYNNYADTTDPNNPSFQESWDKIKDSTEKSAIKELNKMVNQLANGSEACNERRFDQLKAKEQNKNITSEEKTELKKIEQQREATSNKLNDLRQKQDAGTLTTEEQRELNQIEQKQVKQNEQKANFNQMEELSKKKINGTITSEEQQQLQDLTNKCSEHRKEYFFQTSADYRDKPENELNNKAFKESVSTFTNGKNERLCYRIDVEETKKILQQIYGQTNIEDIKINEKNIFANMTTSQYDRLNRVLKEYKGNAKDLLDAATELANDSQFAGQVQTPNDMASITEAINTKLKEFPKKSDKKAYLKSLHKGPTNPTDPKGNNYTDFRNEFNKHINEVKALDPTIRSGWSSELSMAYHYWKHKGDFGTEVKTAQYFTTYSNDLFSPNNITVTGHNQFGGIRTSYAKSFGTRLHVGFTFGENQTKDSHFVHKSPYD